MSKTQQNSRRADDGTAVPRFVISPPARCYHREKGSTGLACGEIASWMRPGRWWFEIAFYCDEHHESCDVPIAGEQVFRRVHTTVQVYFAGTSAQAPAAQTEALDRLRRAIESAGGVVEVDWIRSTFGRAPVHGAAGDRRANSDDAG